MKLCELRKPLPNEPGKRWPRRLLRGHLPGRRLYVHTSELADFAHRALPRIAADFVLVTGDHVSPAGPDALAPGLFRVLAEHPHLQHWYAQNLAGAHPKVSPLPLGLDYHTMSLGRRPEWGPTASPLAQEAQLLEMRASQAALKERPPKGYSNWHFAPDNPKRAALRQVLGADVSTYEPHRVPRLDSWRQMTEHFFTISPEGRGMDCHRTWEALLLGSVPIIPDLPINRLFASLPVVVVSDWACVTPAFLAERKERLLGGVFDFAPLFLETWRRRLHQEPALPPLRMSYQDFMRMGRAEFQDYLGAS